MTAQGIFNGLPGFVIVEGMTVPEFPGEDYEGEAGVAVLEGGAAGEFVREGGAAAGVESTEALESGGVVEDAQGDAVADSEVGLLAERAGGTGAVLVEERASVLGGEAEVGEGLEGAVEAAFPAGVAGEGAGEAGGDAGGEGGGVLGDGVMGVGAQSGKHFEGGGLLGWTDSAVEGAGEFVGGDDAFGTGEGGALGPGAEGAAGGDGGEGAVEGEGAVLGAELAAFAGGGAPGAEDGAEDGRAGIAHALQGGVRRGDDRGNAVSLPRVTASMLRVEFSNPWPRASQSTLCVEGVRGVRRCLSEVLVQLVGALMPSRGACPVTPCALPCVGVANVGPQWGAGRITPRPVRVKGMTTGLMQAPGLRTDSVETVVRLALGEVPRADDERWLRRTLAWEALGGLLRVWGDVGVLGALGRIVTLTLEDLLALEGLSGADGALRGAVARVQDLSSAHAARVWGEVQRVAAGLLVA